MSLAAQALATELGLFIPDYAKPSYGERYGAITAFHRVNLTVEPGYAAARLKAVHTLRVIRNALGVARPRHEPPSRAVLRGLPTGVRPTPDVSNGVSDLFLDVFADEADQVGRAWIGATALARGNCVEPRLSPKCEPEPACG